MRRGPFASIIAMRLRARGPGRGRRYTACGIGLDDAAMAPLVLSADRKGRPFGSIKEDVKRKNSPNELEPQIFSESSPRSPARYGTFIRTRISRKLNLWRPWVKAPYNKMRMRNGYYWIRTHAIQFLKLSAARVFYYWFPSQDEGWPARFYWIMSALGIWGVWISRKNRLALSLALARLFIQRRLP